MAYASILCSTSSTKKIIRNTDRSKVVCGYMAMAKRTDIVVFNNAGDEKISLIECKALRGCYKPESILTR